MPGYLDTADPSPETDDPDAQPGTYPAVR